MLVTHRPAAPLAAHVESLWLSSREALAHDRERSLPTGRVDIVVPLLQESIVRYEGVDSTLPVHLRGAVVSGAHDRYSVRGMGGASSVLGVHFKPGGAAAFFGPALAEIANRTVLLESLWGPAACELRERLQAAGDAVRRFAIVEDALLARLHGPGSLAGVDRLVPWALQAFARDPSAARVDAVQRASRCSPQQFTRRFDAAVGMTPKRYARVLRFNALLPRLARVGPRDWAEVAVDGGYYDQSHLIHEFRRLSGVTPTAYAPLSDRQLTHVPVGAAAKNLQYAVGAPG